MGGEASRGRLVWIDELRFVAFCAIVLLHVSSVETTVLTGHDLVVFATRFAVPVFFLISGHLIGARNREPDAIIRNTASRLVPVFLFWEIVYTLIDVGFDGAFFPLPRGELLDWARFLLGTLYAGGPAFHLWFVVWSGVSIKIVADLWRVGERFAWGVAVALFLLGAALGPYGVFTGLSSHVGPLAPNPLIYTARNGPFFGPLFLLVGASVARRDLRASLPAALGLIGGGYVLQVVEGMAIARGGGGFVSIWDVSLGTPAMAIGVFLLFRRLRDGVTTSPIARLGRVSLGAYCIHAMFTNVWALLAPPQTRVDTPLLAIAVVAAMVVVASVGAALLLARVDALRRFVV